MKNQETNLFLQIDDDSIDLFVGHIELSDEELGTVVGGRHAVVISGATDCPKSGCIPPCLDIRDPD